MTTDTNKSNFTIKGSAETVSEFFGYSINSILFQRGIYPPETFSRVQKYGLGLFVTSDDELKKFISNVLEKVQEWLKTGDIHKLVLVVSSIEPDEVLERWSFDVHTDAANNNSGVLAESNNNNTNTANTSQAKTSKAVNGEIAAIMRQIAASVTFLPLLEAACSFDVLMYTDQGVAVPLECEESAPRYIANAQHVRLRSVDTAVHKVETTVAYKIDE